MNAFRVLICAALPWLWLESAIAQPTLTTIRDTVYRADGAPFNGIVTIEWKSFQSGNQTNIGTQATTVRIVAGALFVRLSPTTASGNGSYYLVRYNSNGQFQFSEIWAIPPTTAVLRLRDVRANLLPGGIVVGGGAGGVVIGNLGGGAGFADGETPGGVVNGSNNAFTLVAAPNPSSSLALYRNGLLQSPVSDYNLSGAIITFVSAAIPQSGDLLRAYYRSGSGEAAVTAHALLSTTHSDTAAAAAARGALVVGQGTTPAWSRLTLGAANRCLTSNGTDAVWNTCLYTGFATGSIPFTAAGGILSENSAALLWNNTDRRMTVGNNISTRATLYVYDDRPSAVTELLVRAGAGQASTPIQQWFASNGDAVAWVNADGGFNVRRVLTGSTSLRAALSDVGTLVDPSASAVGNGDLWFNRATATWKSREAGQSHTGPQIICSAGGSTTGSTATIGTCTVPGGFLLAGDRFVIEAHFRRATGAGDFTAEIRLGSTVLVSQVQAAGDSAVGLRTNLTATATQVAWSTLAIRNASVAGSVGEAAFTAGSGAQLQFVATPGVGTDQTLQLQNFTVTRYPAQSNP